MDFEWIAIALGDVAWISLAFTLGLCARLINLPPMLGFLATGFTLNALGYTSGDMLQKLADLGITLLLFSIGLKLDLKSLARPYIWGVTSLHTGLCLLLLTPLVYALSLGGVYLFADLSLQSSLLLVFALSFSSTVFVVKVLEDQGEMKSLHGRIAIGILIMQDLFAVIFLALSSGKIPSYWAFALLALIPARGVFIYLLNKTGHGELLILYGFVLALGGAEVFELASVKGDLGALSMGILISGHSKAKELAKTMLNFKDLFLVGFFLTIGMSGELSWRAVLIGALITPLMLIKSALFFLLLTQFKLRARTAMLATFNLSNFSEFGLIVAAIAVSNSWLDPQWQIAIACALAFSFIVAAPLNDRGHILYARFGNFWRRFQGQQRITGDMQLSTADAKIAVFGMGRVGSGAYDRMREIYGDTVIGVDFDLSRVQQHREEGRKVIQGDPSDPDFWDKLDRDHQLDMILLALPNIKANLDALDQLAALNFHGKIAATALYPDEEEQLREAGVAAVFNIYTEAGVGFADHVIGQSSPS